MPNECPIIITRGKNKGKECGHVNKKCRHRNNQCPHCGIRFTMETSYSRHMSTCTGDRKLPMEPKVVINVTVKSTGAPPEPRPELTREEIKARARAKRERAWGVKPQILETKPIPQPKPSPVPKPESESESESKSKTKTKTKPKPGSDLEDKLHTIPNHILLEKIEELQRELEVVKQTPAVQVQHHHWNIVLGMNFFDELVLKMGKDRTIKFLSGIAQEGKPVDVINKLYLEGTSPTDYPIACRDTDHFRYIDSDHRLIDDKGGHEISKIVTSGVQDALVLAAKEVLDTEQIDYLHKYVEDMRRSLPKDRIIHDLAHMTRIPNHPFFTDNEESEPILDTSNYKCLAD